jgi:hypothetical protein
MKAVVVTKRKGGKEIHQGAVRQYRTNRHEKVAEKFPERPAGPKDALEALFVRPPEKAQPHRS